MAQLKEPIHTDVLIIGAGGAGMMCAIHAGRRGRHVTLLDHAEKLGGKILISGGGRCNFTNTGASPAQYVSQNPHFCKSALSRYPSSEFVAMVESHKIAYHEKKLGQLFCDHSAQAIVTLLERECANVEANFELDCSVQNVEVISETESPRFKVQTSNGTFTSDSLVIASGGLSIPKIGASGFGYQLAKQFNLKVVDRAPALDGFVLQGTSVQTFCALSGLSVDCTITCNGVTFRENILFTHTGLSGPAALQASLHWYTGNEVKINLTPDVPDLFAWFMQKKKEGNKSLVKNLLSEMIPSRLADLMCELHFPSALPLPDVSEKALKVLCEKIQSWTFVPGGTVGYNKAEVTRGGVDTNELSSKTMESKKVKGLYFIGEVVDVTGWLGGYNFQWAWASGFAAGQVV